MLKKSKFSLCGNVLAECGLGSIFAELPKSIAEKDTVGFFSRAGYYITRSFFQTYQKDLVMIFPALGENPSVSIPAIDLGNSA